MKIAVLRIIWIAVEIFNMGSARLIVWVVLLRAKDAYSWILAVCDI